MPSVAARLDHGTGGAASAEQQGSGAVDSLLSWWRYGRDSVTDCCKRRRRDSEAAAASEGRLPTRPTFDIEDLVSEPPRQSDLVDAQWKKWNPTSSDTHASGPLQRVSEEGDDAVDPTARGSSSSSQPAHSSTEDVRLEVVVVDPLGSPGASVTSPTHSQAAEGQAAPAEWHPNLQQGGSSGSSSPASQTEAAPAPVASSSGGSEQVFVPPTSSQSRTSVDPEVGEFTFATRGQSLPEVVAPLVSEDPLADADAVELRLDELGSQPTTPSPTSWGVAEGQSGSLAPLAQLLAAAGSAVQSPLQGAVARHADGGEEAEAEFVPPTVQAPWAPRGRSGTGSGPLPPVVRGQNSPSSVAVAAAGNAAAESLSRISSLGQHAAGPSDGAGEALAAAEAGQTEAVVGGGLQSADHPTVLAVAGTMDDSVSEDESVAPTVVDPERSPRQPSAADGLSTEAVCSGPAPSSGQPCSSAPSALTPRLAEPSWEDQESLAAEPPCSSPAELAGGEAPAQPSPWQAGPASGAPPSGLESPNPAPPTCCRDHFVFPASLSAEPARQSEMTARSSEETPASTPSVSIGSRWGSLGSARTGGSRKPAAPSDDAAGRWGDPRNFGAAMAWASAGAKRLTKAAGSFAGSRQVSVNSGCVASSSAGGAPLTTPVQSPAIASLVSPGLTPPTSVASTAASKTNNIAARMLRSFSEDATVSSTPGTPAASAPMPQCPPASVSSPAHEPWLPPLRQPADLAPEESEGAGGALASDAMAPEDALALPEPAAAARQRAASTPADSRWAQRGSAFASGLRTPSRQPAAQHRGRGAEAWQPALSHCGRSPACTPSRAIEDSPQFEALPARPRRSSSPYLETPVESSAVESSAVPSQPPRASSEGPHLLYRSHSCGSQQTQQSALTLEPLQCPEEQDGDEAAISLEPSPACHATEVSLPREGAGSWHAAVGDGDFFRGGLRTEAREGSKAAAALAVFAAMDLEEGPQEASFQAVSPLRSATALSAASSPAHVGEAELAAGGTSGPPTRSQYCSTPTPKTPVKIPLVLEDIGQPGQGSPVNSDETTVWPHKEADALAASQVECAVETRRERAVRLASQLALAQSGPPSPHAVVRPPCSSDAEASEYEAFTAASNRACFEDSVLAASPLPMMSSPEALLWQPRHHHPDPREYMQVAALSEEFESPGPRRAQASLLSVSPIRGITPEPATPSSHMRASSAPPRDAEAAQDADISRCTNEHSSCGHDLEVRSGQWLQDASLFSARVPAPEGDTTTEASAAVLEVYEVPHESLGSELIEASDYLLDNSVLLARAKGLKFRVAKRLEDAVGSTLPWGTIVKGVDEGDGWLRVGDKFLPLNIKGKPVLVLYKETDQLDRVRMDLMLLKGSKAHRPRRRHSRKSSDADGQQAEPEPQPDSAAQSPSQMPAAGTPLERTAGSSTEAFPAEAKDCEVGSEQPIRGFSFGEAMAAAVDATRHEVEDSPMDHQSLVLDSPDVVVDSTPAPVAEVEEAAATDVMAEGGDVPEVLDSPMVEVVDGVGVLVSWLSGETAAWESALEVAGYIIEVDDGTSRLFLDYHTGRLVESAQEATAVPAGVRSVVLEGLPTGVCFRVAVCALGVQGGPAARSPQSAAVQMQTRARAKAPALQRAIVTSPYGGSGVRTGRPQPLTPAWGRPPARAASASAPRGSKAAPERPSRARASASQPSALGRRQQPAPRLQPYRRPPPQAQRHDRSASGPSARPVAKVVGGPRVVRVAM